MRGRHPKPTALKELAGNPGKRALNHDEPKLRRKLPRCPEHLSEDAKREWRRVVRELYDAGLLTGVDRAALAAYCQAWARWAEAEEALKIENKVCVTDKGYAHPNPWIGIANGALEQLRKFMAEFGMTPSSRTRVKISKPEPEDPFEAYVRKKLNE